MRVSLEEMFGEDGAGTATILPEAAVMRLQEYRMRFGDNPFGVGQLVTPRAGHNIRGAGDPHIVLYSIGGYTHPGAGSPVQNIYIAYLHGDHIRALWVAAHDFEPYQAEDVSP